MSSTNTNTSTFPAVKLGKTYSAMASQDGEGANVFRIIGTPKLDSLDPFLMLDEFHVAPPGGFPSHPHRGFETVTYMLGGAFKHKDNQGHSGTINPGDVQWMTAGKGIIHSEMPATNGDNYGLQLWVNLAAKDKMTKPQYQELPAKSLANGEFGNLKLVVVAGESRYGLKSPVFLRTQVLFVHATISKADEQYVEDIPAKMQGFLYVHKGSVTVGSDTKLQEKQLVMIPEDAEKRSIQVKSNADNTQLFIITGVPLKEPIARYGPFVMNTREEIVQAFQDYHSGKF